MTYISPKESGLRTETSVLSVLCPLNFSIPQVKNSTQSPRIQDLIPDPGIDFTRLFLFWDEHFHLLLVVVRNILFYRERCNGMPLLLILYMENRESDLYATWITRDVPLVTYSRPHVQKGLCEEKTWGCS